MTSPLAAANPFVRLPRARTLTERQATKGDHRWMAPSPFRVARAPTWAGGDAASGSDSRNSNTQHTDGNTARRNAAFQPAAVAVASEQTPPANAVNSAHTPHSPLRTSSSATAPFGPIPAVSVAAVSCPCGQCCHLRNYQYYHHPEYRSRCQQQQQQQSDLLLRHQLQLVLLNAHSPLQTDSAGTGEYSR